MTFMRKQYRKRYQNGYPYLEQLADGRWVHKFRWRETQPDGTRKLRNFKIGFKDEMTEAEVQRAIGILRVQINRDVPNSVGTLMTVQQLADHFLATEIRDGERTQATKDGYHSSLKNWILPQWGPYRICDLSTIAFKEWLRNLTGLLPGSKAKLRNHMHAMFNHAIEYQWLNANPITRVRTSSKRLHVPTVLDIREIQLILDRLSGLERILAVLDAATGLRVSELLALKWEDIDFENLRISVRHSIVHQVVGDCKTEASRKPLEISGYLAEELWHWKLVTPYNQPSDWTAASPRMRGKQPLWPEGLRTHIQEAAKEAGITKRVGWHTFRHSFGTLLVANAENVKVVQELMRHQNIRVTLEMYAQALRDQKRAAHEKVLHMIRHKGRQQRKSGVRKHRPNVWSDEA